MTTKIFITLPNFIFKFKLTASQLHNKYKGEDKSLNSQTKATDVFFSAVKVRKLDINSNMSPIIA